MISVTFNGTPFHVAPGTTILEAATMAHIPIPTLCFHPGLPPDGNCRLCSVEVIHRGRRNVVMACSYPITTERLEIYTDTEKIRNLRRFVLSLFIKKTPHTPDLLALCSQYDLEVPQETTEAATPNCILCGLCVRACETEGVGCLDFSHRGHLREVGPAFHASPEDCTGCGACAEVCPTGFIKKIDTQGTRTLWGKTFQLVQCQSCGKAFATQEQIQAATCLQMNQKLQEHVGIYCPSCLRKMEARAMALLETAKE